MSVTLTSGSWANLSQLREVDRLEFWETPTFPEIEDKRDDDQVYRVMSTDRIDNLAVRFYGDQRLWWVIALANDLRLLPIDLKPGRTLRIPQATFVRGLLNQIP